MQTNSISVDMATNTDELTCWLQKYQELEGSDAIPFKDVLSRGAINYGLLCNFDFQGGRNVLHVAIERNHPTIIRSVISALPVHLRIDLMTMKDMTGNTAIHFAVIYNRHEILQDILSSDRSERCPTLKLLLTPNYNSLTAAVLAASEGRYPMIEVMLQSLTDPEECLKLLSSRDLCGYTVFHKSVVEASISTVRSIRRYITGKHLDLLMKSTDDINCFTPLHEATHRARTDMVIALMDHLTDEQKLELLQINDGDGNTVRDLAVREGYTEISGNLETKTTTSSMFRKGTQEKAAQDGELYIKGPCVPLRPIGLSDFI